MQQPENFETDTMFGGMFGDPEVNSDKKTIKLLLVPTSDFVELGKQLLLEVLNRFATDETYYGFIHDEWKK